MPVPGKTKAGGASSSAPKSLGARPGAAKSRHAAVMGSASSKAGGPLVDVMPRALWLWRHSPDAWELVVTDEGAEVLPKLCLHPVIGGVNGVRTRDEGEAVEAAYEQSVKDHQNNGWTFIDPTYDVPADCLPDGVEPGPYVREDVCRIGKAQHAHWRSAWDVPYETRRGRKLRHDNVAFDRFRRWLIEAEVLEAPDLGILDEMAERCRKRADAIEGRPGHPEGSGLQARRAKQIEGLRKAAESLVSA